MLMLASLLHGAMQTTRRTSISAVPAGVQEFDGGSRGNPGPAGYGSVLRDDSTGKLVGC